MTIELTRELVRTWLPTRPPDGHKGTFGHVLIIAGSRGFTGATRLSAEAGTRSGAGLVTLAIPSAIESFVVPALMEAMWKSLPSTGAGTFSVAALEGALAATEGKQAVVVGPGISTDDETKQFVKALVASCRVPMLLDADALNALSDDPSAIARANAAVVITPHPGEMARLTGIDTSVVQGNRESTARDVAARCQCLVVLKGQRTIVADPAGTTYTNPTGNSGMATGGTGDVLSGLIGGLMAQRMAPLEAAAAGVFVHGLAGDIAAARKSERGMIARDVIDAIPDAWCILERGK